MGKHVLATGACGFIGSHFVQHVLEETDWTVTVLDGLSYAADPSRLPSSDRVKPVYWDLRSPINEALSHLIGPVDYVVNFASDSHVDRSIAAPVPFVLNNVGLMLTVLEWVREARPAKFVQVSTDEVFGPAPDGYRFREWDRHCPSNPYAASKSAQEALAVAWWRTYGVPLILTNTMNNFGERQHREKFVPLVIERLRAGLPVPVHAERTAEGWKAGSRVWLHARNHADALLFILRGIEPVPFPAADKPARYNVAGDRELSNLEIVEKVAGILGTAPLVEFVDWHRSRPGHDSRYALDGGKLRAAGWKPPLDLEESFARTVRSFV